MTVCLTKNLTRCAICPNPVPSANFIECDPICTACSFDLHARDMLRDLDNNNPIELSNYFADSRILLGAPIFPDYYHDPRDDYEAF